MVKLKHQRKHDYRWIHFNANVLLLVTSMAILCIWSQAQGKLLEEYYTNNNCSEYLTCNSCTNNTENNCNWSLEEQRCENQMLSMGRFIIRERRFCPRYLVEKIDDHKHQILYKLTLSLDGTLIDFYKFIQTNNITCFVWDWSYIGSVHNPNIINCGYYTLAMKSRKTLVIPIVVKVNNISIKLENDNDYYFTVYDRSCGIKPDDNCVTCLWHDSQYRYYNRWCSSRNTCTGLWQTSWTHSMHSGDVIPNVQHTQLMCPEIEIQLIGPKPGVLGGKTAVNFVVTNHRILIENQTMTVTVAGWDCVNATYDISDRITCTVHHAQPPNSTVQNHKGPVRVTYRTQQNYTYAVTSKQLFEFVEPVLKNVSTACVPVDGGYELTVFGRHMDAGDAAEVTIAERVGCTTSRRDPERIVCTTSGAGSPAVGRVKVRFDGSPGRYVDGTTVTVYPNGGAELDEHQRFEGIASGGTRVSVRGRHFTCATSASLKLVRDGTDDRHAHTVCAVRNDTYMVCRSPKIAMPQRADTLVTDVQLLVSYPSGASKTAVAADSSNAALALVTYPDPEFVGFRVQNGSVVINVRGPNRGYETDDLTVRFPNTADRCVVTERASDRVLCVPSTPSVILADVLRLVVSVGDTFECNVTLVRDADPWYLRFTGVWWTLAAIPVVVTLTISVVLGLCLGRRRQYNVGTSNDFAELQPVDQFKPATS